MSSVERMVMVLDGQAPAPQVRSAAAQVDGATVQGTTVARREDEGGEPGRPDQGDTGVEACR